MANLTNKQIKDTYNSLLKLDDNGDLSGTRKEITDGLGNGSNVKINNLGSLEAAEFVKTGGLATEFLKADGTVDTSTYLTSETDPVFLASPAYGITTTDLTNYDDAYDWGDHSTESYATETYVTDEINAVLDLAPDALNTLNELAAAIGDDDDFAGTMTTALAGKAASAHTHDIADLNDFDVTTPASENIFLYNDTASKWENKDITDITSYNNTDWDTAYTNRLDYSTQGYITESSLDSATDSDIDTPTNDQALLYNSTTSLWENKDISTDNFYLDGATFDDADGVITMTVNGSDDVTVDIDGRYSLDTHGHSLSSTSASGFMSSDQFDKLEGIAENADNYSSFTVSDSEGTPNTTDIGSGNTLNFEAFGSALVTVDDTTKTVNITSANTQRTDEEIEDVVGAMVAAGTGITIDYAEPTNVLTITNSVSNSDTVTRLTADDTNYLTGDVTFSGGTNITLTQAANDIEISATDTNTQRSDQDIDDRIALNPEGFISSYTDTTRSDEEIEDVVGAMITAGTGITVDYADPTGVLTITNDVTNSNTVTRVSGDETNYLTGDVDIIGGTNVTVSQATNEITITATDTNTQRTNSEIDARIALNPEGFIDSYTDTNTQRTDEEVQDVVGGMVEAGTGISVSYNDPTGKLVITNDVSNSNTVTRVSGDSTNFLTGDVEIIGGTNVTVSQATNEITITAADTNTQRAIHDTPTDGATTTSISSNWAFDNVKTAVPTGAVFTDTNTNTQRSDEEIRDTIGAIISGSGATTVTVNDAANTIVVSSTDTNTDTNTQRSDEDIRDVVASMLTGGTGITVTENDPSNTLTITNDVANSNTVTRISGDGTNFLTGDVKIVGGGATTVTQATNEITITSTDTNTNTFRGIHDTPSNGATTTSISSNWAFDNVKTAVPTGALFTDTNTNTFRGIHDSPVNGATTTSISSNWAFDNVKTAVPTGAVFTDNNTTYSVGDGGLTTKNFTAALKTKLDGIATSANNITNNNQISNGAGYITSYVNTVYTHPNYASTNINTSGATIVDIITTNATGHVTNLGTRTLTLANIGYSGATNANYITNNNQLSNGAGYITGYTDTNTTYTGGSYINLSGTTFNLATSASGDRWGKAMHIGSDGGMEAGLYMDFHTSDADTSDYAARITASAAKLTVTGGLHSSGTITAAGDVIAYYSDERLKKDKKVIENALDRVSKMSGYTYRANHNAELLGITNTDLQIGLMAQEVEKAMPEAVRVSPIQDKVDELGLEGLENVKTVQYDRLVALLIQSTNELNEKVRVLEDKLQNKHIEFTEVMRRIEKLENK